MTKAAYEEMTTAIVDEVKKGCDAVLLALHGAMVAEHYDDGEGELCEPHPQDRARRADRRGASTSTPR